MNVTQQITDFLGGVSQASDIQKFPNEVDELINGYPDDTYGVLKRPGTQFLYGLDIDDPFDFKWFAITNETIPYYGCVGNNQVHLWSGLSGVKQTVTGDMAYLTDVDGVRADQQYKVVALEKGIIVTNNRITVQKSDENTPGTLTTTVSNFDNLPDSPEVDDIVEISNTDSEYDNYYVKWDGTSWVEVVKPGIELGLDASTMPHAIVKTGENTWIFSPIDYAGREVGDDKSNPQPSFVGLSITNAFSYLNRIGFLAGSNVVMSQPLIPDNDNIGQTNPINFYVNSAFVQSDADPVDINASSVRTITLRSVLPGRQGLVIFADKEQFLLFSDSGIITPGTATVRGISTWEMVPRLDPVELDSEYFFVSGRQPYNEHSRLIKMITRGLEEDPITTDVSKVVSEWIPSNVYELQSSTQEQFVALTTFQSNTIWFYRYFKNEGEVRMQSWFKWEFDFRIVSFTIINGNLYIIGINDDDQVFSVFAALNNAPSNKVLANTTTQPAVPFLPVKPNIDCYARPVENGVDYVNSRTRIEMPDGFPILDGADAVVLLAENTMPRSLQYQNIQAGYGFPVEWDSASGRFVSTSSINMVADAERMVLGYLFRYQIDLPTLYYRNGDTVDFSARLNISRCKFECSAGLQGALSFQVRADGYADYDAIYEVGDADQYDADDLPLVKTRIFEVPVHKQNRYYTMAVVSDTPFPIALNSMTWEGDYSPRFYRRA